MTTPDPQQQIRIALSEIPNRFEALRFEGATTPTTANQRRSPNEPTATATPFYGGQHLDNTTNMALAQEYTDPSMLSPDEVIIRQRGRRNLNTVLSPENTPKRIPFQRTPTKIPLTSGMILRSSPRKRLTMGSTPPIQEPPVMPSPTKARQQLWPGVPVPKRLRLSDVEERPMAQLHVETPLSVLLQGLSQQQLIELIVGEVKSGDVKIEERLRARLPVPDIKPLEEELLHCKRQIFRSLPTSRLCKKTDSSAYSRAVLHLNDFKRLLIAHTKQLSDSTHWDALVDYVIMAWPHVRATPNWDSTAHNVVRRQSFKLLACHCIAALKNGGMKLGVLRLHSLDHNLREWTSDNEEVQSCLNILNKTLTKGRTTL